MSGEKALHRFFDIVGEELAETTTTSSTDVNIQFDIEGAGTWSIVTNQGEGVVYCDARPNPDCTVSAHVETLLQIAHGRMKPAMAFLRNKIRLSGNKAVFGCLKVPLQRAGERFRLEWQSLAQNAELPEIGDLSVAVKTVEVGKSATYYCITVGLDSSKWEVKARYSTLRTLHDSISSDIKGLTFPGRLVFHTTTSRESRRGKLDRYFSEVGSRHSTFSPFAQQQLQRFFEVEAHLPEEQKRRGQQDSHDGQSSPIPEAVPMDPEVAMVPGVLLKLVLSDLYKDQRQHIMCQSGFSSPRMQSILQRLHELEKLVVQGASGGLGLDSLAQPWKWAIVRNTAHCLLQVCFLCMLLLCVMNAPLAPNEYAAATADGGNVRTTTDHTTVPPTTGAADAACPVAYANGDAGYGAELRVAAAMTCARESVATLLVGVHKRGHSVASFLQVLESVKSYAPNLHERMKSSLTASSTGTSRACAGLPVIDPWPLLYRQYEIYFVTTAPPSTTAQPASADGITSTPASSPFSSLSFSGCAYLLTAQAVAVFAIITLLTLALAPPPSVLSHHLNYGLRARARYTFTFSLRRAPQLAVGSIFASYCYLYGRGLLASGARSAAAVASTAMGSGAAAAGVAAGGDLASGPSIGAGTDALPGGASAAAVASTNGISGWWGSSWHHLLLPLLHCVLVLLRSPAFISLPAVAIGAAIRCRNCGRRRRRRLGERRRFAVGARLNAYARLVHVYGTAFVAIGAYTSLRVYLWFTGRWLNVSIDKSKTDALYADLDRWVGPFVCSQIVQLKSVFVKFGQYLGGRTDIVPKGWSDALEQLQDDMPASPKEYVLELLLDELGDRGGNSGGEGGVQGGVGGAAAKAAGAMGAGGAAGASSKKEAEEERKLLAMVGISAIDWAPVASASIAQVHRAKLNDEAQTEVALKVQHCGVAEQFVEDSHAVLAIIRLIAWLNSDFDGMLMVWRAYSNTMINELDFRHEAKNLREVGNNMRNAKLEVIVPQPMPFRGRLLVSKRVFAMRFAEGFKITDHVCLSEHGVDKSALMRRVVQAYSQQLFRDGFFNADPHAGNIHVQVDVYRGRCTPVLLDFGMVVRLNRKQRLGYAQLMNAVAAMDVSGVHQALEQVGFRNSQSARHPERDLEFFNFIARDTGSRSSQRADSQKFFRDRGKQKEADITSGERDTRGSRGGRTIEAFPESLIFLFRVIGLLRGLCTSLDVRVPFLQLMVGYARVALVEAWAEDVHANCWSPTIRRPPSMLMPSQLRPRHKPLERRPHKPQSFSTSSSPRRPQSSSASAHGAVRSPQVITVSRSGRSAGTAESPSKMTGGRSDRPSSNLRLSLEGAASRNEEDSFADAALGTSDTLELAPALSPLDAKVAEALNGMCLAGLAVGIQVAVVRRGELLVDACAGVLGATDPRPVEHASLFPLLDLSQLLPSLAVHMLVDDGRLRYQDTVARHWPAFAQNGKDSITVADVLSHSTIVPVDATGALPSSMLPHDLADWDAVVAALEAAPAGAPAAEAEAEAEATATAAAAADPAGEAERERERESDGNEGRPVHECRYHSLSNGFILAVLVAKVAKSSWASFAVKHLLEPLQLQQELRLSLLGMQPPANSRPHAPSDGASDTIHDVTEPSLSCFTPLTSAASKSGGNGGDGSTVIMPTGPSTPPQLQRRAPSSAFASATAAALPAAAASAPLPLAVASTSNAFAAELQAFRNGEGGSGGGSGGGAGGGGGGRDGRRGGGMLGMGSVADAPMVRAAAHLGRSSFLVKDRYTTVTSTAKGGAVAGPVSGRIGTEKKKTVAGGAAGTGGAVTASSARVGGGGRPDAAASIAGAAGAAGGGVGATQAHTKSLGETKGLQEALGWALRDPGMVNRSEVRTAIVPSLNTFSSARALAVLMSAAYCWGDEEEKEGEGGAKNATRSSRAGSLVSRLPLGSVHVERIRTVRAIDHSNELYGPMRWGMGLQMFDFSHTRVPSGNLPGVRAAQRSHSEVQRQGGQGQPARRSLGDRQDAQQGRKEERRRQQEEQRQAQLRRVLGHQVRWRMSVFIYMQRMPWKRVLRH
jgi:aarF domain-containing kinase